MSASTTNLQFLKRSAKRLLNDMHARHPGALARLAAHRSQAVTDPATVKLADAQRIIARENGFSSWAQLKQRTELADRIAATPRHPHVQAAVEAIDRGDVQTLGKLLAANPDLIAARCELDGPIHYFTGATLLHYIAWNPTPDSRRSGLALPADAAMPASMPASAKLLIGAGADPHAMTFTGSSVLSLLLTAKKPSDAGLAEPLIQIMLDAGCAIDADDDPVGMALANHSSQAARMMIDRGYPLGLREAAALGMADRLPTFFDGDTLTPAAWGGLEHLPAPHLIGLAALHAYVLGQHQSVIWLLNKPGNWNVIGVNNGTLLHRAAGDGDVTMVSRMVDAGADVNNRDNPFRATPQDWADHSGQTQTLAWLDEHTVDRMDLWQAARWGKVQRIDTICQADPTAVDAVTDIWHLRRVTALRVAVIAGHSRAVRALIRHGADPNHLAGDGTSPQQEGRNQPPEVQQALRR